MSKELGPFEMPIEQLRAETTTSAAIGYCQARACGRADLMAEIESRGFSAIRAGHPIENTGKYDLPFGCGHREFSSRVAAAIWADYISLLEWDGEILIAAERPLPRDLPIVG